MRRAYVLSVALLAIGCSSHTGVAPGGLYISPQIFQGHVSKDGWTSTAIKPINGKTAFPAGLASDAHHNIWVTAANQDGAGSLTKIDMDQQVATYPLRITPDAIAFGSDQNLWITSGGNPNPGVVARIRLTGADTAAETDFSLAPGMRFSSIVSGSDGALWFTECSPDLQFGGIGEITTSGSYTYYPLIRGCQYAIASGPDGNIWFGDGVNIYSVTVNGHVFTQYPVGDIFFTGIAAGSDGALYVTSAGIGYELVRVTTSGTVTRIGADPYNDALSSIVNGPDGKLWISTFRQASRHLITFDPTTSTWGARVKSHACGSLIAGPDSNIWEPDCTGGFVDTYVRLAITLAPKLLAVPVGQTAPLNVSESNYAGQWTAISSSPSIVTVTLNSINGAFVLTGVAPGTTAVTVYDTIFNSASAEVTVSPTGHLQR